MPFFTQILSQYMCCHLIPLCHRYVCHVGNLTVRHICHTFHDVTRRAGSYWSWYRRLTLERQFVWVFALTFLVVMPILCHDLKHSPYNVIGRLTKGRAIFNQLKSENDARVELAREYFMKLNPVKPQRTFKSIVPVGERETEHEHDIALTIVTLSRNRLGKSLDNYEPHYLTQVVWKWLVLIQKAQEDGFPYNIQISICNVDHDPDTFLEAQEMSKFIPVFNRFNKTYTADIPRKEKEKQDYVYCLNQSLDQKPRYVFLLEDDALPRDEVFTVLRHTLDNHVERKYRRGEFHKNEEEIAWIKFYHPEWEGFIRLYPDRLPEMIGIGAILGTILTLVFERWYPHQFNLYKVWLIFILYAMLLAHFTGRDNLMQFRRWFTPQLYSVVPSPGCCIPGVLYPYEGGRRLAAYLNQITCHEGLPKDLAFGRFLSENSIKAYLAQPNSLTHIGMYSSVRAKIDPSRV